MITIGLILVIVGACLDHAALVKGGFLVIAVDIILQLLNGGLVR